MPGPPDRVAHRGGRRPTATGLAVGRTDREIADELYFSKKTASVHVSNLLRKPDVANRVEAGRIGQTHGLG